MSILDDFRDRFGPDALKTPERKPVNNWHELCACGHLDRYHSKTIGGSYNVPPVRTQRVSKQSDELITITLVFGGCVGAPPNRGAETTRYSAVDREALTMTETLIPTCPCEDFAPVARVDRPNRYFSQRVPVDLTDPIRHPFLVGVRAFSTHLSRRRAALSDPSWATAEFDRRFVWLTEQRVCSMSRCEATDGVWPVYLIVRDGDHDRVSTVLRCAKHPV